MNQRGKGRVAIIGQLESEGARRTMRARTSICGLAVFGMLLAGCASSKQVVEVGPITFTDANGNPLTSSVNSISAGAAVYVEATLGEDKMLLGVDWTVTCGSAPPPGTPLPPGETQDETCGVFLPVHTASGPVPNYASSGAGVVTLFTAPANPPKEGVVTLYAAATADHSRYSTVTLTVVGLPISIQFGSAPPSDLPVNGTASFKAVLTNDYGAGGVNWSVTCGATSCGSFSATKTASGVATTYTAPSTVPPGGIVVVSATSVTDPTKSISTNVTIEPITVSVAAASSSVDTGGTDLVTASVNNDVSNAGVDWALTCDVADACGSIDAHTASGVAATYTAPGTVPGAGQVTIRATSTADKTASGTETVTVTAPPAVSGMVMAGDQPVRGATLSLYAAGRDGYGSRAVPVQGADARVLQTDNQGMFRMAGEISCPFPSSQLYLVFRGGDAGAGENKRIALAGWIGPCSGNLHKQQVVVNEVTTTVLAYALSHFMRDADHLGSPETNTRGVADAGSLVDDLVDSATGKARQKTIRGSGETPQREVNALANLMHRCITANGDSVAEGSPCGPLYSLTGFGATPDTLQAILAIAHQAFDRRASARLYEMALDSGPFVPTLAAEPQQLTLNLRFTPAAMGLSTGGFDSASWVDDAGNTWVADPAGNVITEFLGTDCPGENPGTAVRSSQAAGP